MDELEALYSDSMRVTAEACYMITFHLEMSSSKLIDTGNRFVC